MSFTEDIKNKIDFFIRQKTKFSRKNYSPKSENVENLFESSPLLKLREQELDKKYGLSVLRQNSSIYNYRENLYTLDILDKYFQIESQETLTVLDIGSKNWFYAKGEYAFFKAHCQNLNMTGMELDAHRLYSNFYSRYEVAKFNIKNLEGVCYIDDNLLNAEGKFDYIVWILPFVKKHSLIKWGLPLKYFMPAELLKKAHSLLNKGGKMLIINQGEDEYEVQKEMLQDLGISFEPLGEVKSEFLEYGYKRYCLLCE